MCPQVPSNTIIARGGGAQEETKQYLELLRKLGNAQSFSLISYFLCCRLDDIQLSHHMFSGMKDDQLDSATTCNFVITSK